MPVTRHTYYTPARGPGDHIRIVQEWTGPTHVTQTVIRARRCPDKAGGDVAQIELNVQAMPVGGKRASYAATSVHLTPKLARELALALCPELADPQGDWHV